MDVEDVCDASPTFVLTSITSDEPDNGQGDGDKPNDIQGASFGTPDVTFLLRSERSGLGDGRTYTIFYTAADGSGNTAEAEATVGVPHDQSGHANAADGYNATGTGIAKGAEEIHIVVPSTDLFDATLIRFESAQIGNLFGVVEPLATSLTDRNGDGLVDLDVSYRASSVQGLREASGRNNHVAFRYETLDGTGYLVIDAFALGPPIP